MEDVTNSGVKQIEIPIVNTRHRYWCVLMNETLQRPRLR